MINLNSRDEYVLGRNLPLTRYEKDATVEVSVAFEAQSVLLPSEGASKRKRHGAR